MVLGTISSVSAEIKDGSGMSATQFDALFSIQILAIGRGNGAKSSQSSAVDGNKKEKFNNVEYAPKNLRTCNKMQISL